MRARAMGHLPGGIPARVAAKKDKQPVDLTPEQRERFKGTSVHADDKGVYCHTHRARSKSYPDVDSIPDKDIAFIESTGSVRKTADDDQCPYCFDDGLPIGGKEHRCQGCGRTFDLGQRAAAKKRYTLRCDHHEGKHTVIDNKTGNPTRPPFPSHNAAMLYAKDLNEEYEDRVANPEAYREGSLTKQAEADTAGVMVCLIPEEHASIALMEGADSTEDFDEQHITLLYLGSTEDAGGDTGRERLHRAVYDFAIHSGHDVLEGKANGWGVFHNEGEDGGTETVLVALWDIPGIAEFRAALKASLEAHGVPMRTEDHGFTPHQTMRYEDGALTVLPPPVTPAPESVFTHVVISWGEEWSSVALESALGPQQQVAARLRALGFDNRFDETKHPRGGNPTNPGQFSKAPGGAGRGTVVPESKRPQRTKTKDTGDERGQQEPKTPSSVDPPPQGSQPPRVKTPPPEVAKRYHKDVSYRPKGYEGVSDDTFWAQVDRGDVYGMHIPAGEYPVGDPRNDPEYKARDDKVESLAGLKGKYALTTKDEADRTGIGGATDVLFDRMHDPVTGKDEAWSEERSKVHNKILSEFISRVTKGVPKEGKCLVMAGPSGAGKSTFLKMQGSALGVQLDAKGNPVNFLTINPDNFKDDIPMDMSRYPGIGENETAILKHEESSYLAKRATAALMAQGYNVIIDVTLGSAATAQKKYVDAPYAQGYTDYTVALVDGDMANSRQNAGNRWKQTDKETGQRQFSGRFIPMELVESQKPKDPSKFRSVNAEQFMAFSQLPKVKRAVVFDPYDPAKGLQEAKSAIHEAIRRNPALASMIRVEGASPKMQQKTTEISDKINAYKNGQISEDALVHYLTDEVRYVAQEKCPYPKGSVERYNWLRDGRPFTPGSFDEVNLARDLGVLPDSVHDKVVSILWSRAVPVEAD